MDGNGIQWDDDCPIIFNITYENPFSSNIQDDYHDYTLQEQDTVGWWLLMIIDDDWWWLMIIDDYWWLLMIMMGI